MAHPYFLFEIFCIVGIYFYLCSKLEEYVAKTNDINFVDLVPIECQCTA